MRQRALAAAVVMTGLAFAAAALAQDAAPGSAAPISAYDELVKRGEAAVIGADWNACVKYFTEAHKIRASEVTYLAIGRCALERGDYVDALRHLQEGMRYSLTERQRVSVENLKARALKHLGRYRLALQPADATLLLSGQRVQADADGYVWLKVGRYPVEVSAPGYETLQGELLVQAGDDGTLNYSLPALPPQAPVAGPGQTGQGSTEEDGEFPVVPVVLASVGGALLIGSVVTGVLALNEKADLDDRCTLGETGDQCDPTLSDTRDSAETLAIVTDVLWITGTVAVGTGLLLYLLSDGDEESGAGVSASVGPSGGHLALRGRF
jgi:hypothetical protein